MYGSTNVVNFANGGTLNAVDNSHVDAGGNHLTVTLGSNDLSGIYGSADTINVNGSGSSVWVGGNGRVDAIDASINTVNLANGGSVNVADSSHVWVTGNGANVYAYNNDAVLVTGSYNTSSALGSWDHLYLNGYGDNAVVNGTNDTITFGGGGAHNVNVVSGAANTVEFGSGVGIDQLLFQRSGNGLNIIQIGTSNSVYVQDWFNGASNRISQFRTVDGNRTLAASQVNSLVNAMAAFNPPPAGHTVLTAAEQAVVQPILAANWH